MNTPKRIQVHNEVNSKIIHTHCTEFYNKKYICNFCRIRVRCFTEEPVTMEEFNNRFTININGLKTLLERI